MLYKILIDIDSSVKNLIVNGHGIVRCKKLMYRDEAYHYFTLHDHNKFFPVLKIFSWYTTLHLMAKKQNGISWSCIITQSFKKLWSFAWPPLEGDKDYHTPSGAWPPLGRNICSVCSRQATLLCSREDVYLQEHFQITKQCLDKRGGKGGGRPPWNSE